MQPPCGDHRSADIVAAVYERAGEVRNALDLVGNCVGTDEESVVRPIVRDQCGEYATNGRVVMSRVGGPQWVEANVLAWVTGMPFT